MFRTPDGGLWIDQSTQVARLDPLTGTLAPGLPTPRAKNVCSVVTPAGTGFLNATGDTLTWRPLAAAADAARRRVVDRRPGWVATFAPAQPDAVRVLWMATTGANGAQRTRPAEPARRRVRLERQARATTSRPRPAASVRRAGLDIDAAGRVRQPPAPATTPAARRWPSASTGAPARSARNAA